MKLTAENARRTKTGDLVAVVTATSDDGAILHADEVRLGKAASRDKFIEALKERAGNTNGIAGTLLQLFHSIGAETPFRPSDSSGASDSSDSSDRISLTAPGLVEVVPTPAGLAYWFADGLKTCATIEGVTYRPPREAALFDPPTPAALQWVQRDDDGILFDDVAQAFYDHVDLPDDRGYAVMAAWILHTYLTDRSNYSPIPRFHGAKGSGKSTAGDVCGAMARRAIATVSLTGPALFRVTQHYDPTLIIDEVRLAGRDANKDVVDLLNARFGRGRRVVRVNTDKQGLECIESFEVFGATVLAGTEDVPDTCASRSIPFVMERNSRSVRRSLDEKRLKELRERLYAFRCRHLSTMLPEAQRFVRDGRLDDVLMPLHQIVLLVNPSAEKDFIAFGRALEKRRSEEDALGIDAEVVRAIAACEGQVLSNKLRVSAVAAVLNKDRPEGEQMREKTVGTIMSRLGFQPTRTSTGHAARIWDSKRLERLQRRYGLDPDESEESEPSDESDGLKQYDDAEQEQIPF